jgi:hypothetical protein
VVNFGWVAGRTTADLRCPPTAQPGKIALMLLLKERTRLVPAAQRQNPCSEELACLWENVKSDPFWALI